ncbi:MAG: hypothetical protein QGG40_11380 [Myxococcota bacterium]|nr:hypothetical protein [Myxococcota bacterium]
MAKVRLKILGPCPAWNDRVQLGRLTRLDGVHVSVFIAPLGDTPASPEHLKRLKADARLLKALEHPDLLRTVHVTQNRDLPVVVMEGFRGASLQRLLTELPESSPIPSRAVVELCVSVGRSLLNAWNWSGEDSCLIHPGPTPSRILLNDQGQVKLAGLSVWHVGDPPLYPASSIDPPEGALDQADLAGFLDDRDPWITFGLGTLLAQLLSGQPFDSRLAEEDRYDTMVRRAMIHALSRPGEDLPHELVELTRRALTQHPADRLTLAEFVAGLETIAPALGSSSLDSWSQQFVRSRLDALWPDSFEMEPQDSTAPTATGASTPVRDPDVLDATDVFPSTLERPVAPTAPPVDEHGETVLMNRPVFSDEDRADPGRGESPDDADQGATELFERPAPQAPPALESPRISVDSTAPRMGDLGVPIETAEQAPPPMPPTRQSPVAAVGILVVLALIIMLGVGAYSMLNGTGSENVAAPSSTPAPTVEAPSEVLPPTDPATESDDSDRTDEASTPDASASSTGSAPVTSGGSESRDPEPSTPVPARSENPEPDNDELFDDEPTQDDEDLDDFLFDEDLDPSMDSPARISPRTTGEEEPRARLTPSDAVEPAFDEDVSVVPVATPTTFRVEFIADHAEVTNLFVKCHGGREGIGPSPVVIESALKGPCRVTATLPSTQLVASVAVTQSTSFRCFAGGKRSCQ